MTKTDVTTHREFRYEIPMNEFVKGLGIDHNEDVVGVSVLSDAVIVRTKQELQ